MGRKHLLPDEAIKSFVQDMKLGESNGDSDIGEAIVKYQEDLVHQSEITKFHHILAYQMELAYNLAISPDKNMSKSPGFESLLGVTSSEA